MATLSLSAPPRPRGGLACGRAYRLRLHTGAIGDLCMKIHRSIAIVRCSCSDKCRYAYAMGNAIVVGRASVGLELDAVKKYPVWVGNAKG